jgi:hypothetical protein
LEELVPEEKESTGLEDLPDLTAGEVPVIKRRSRRRRWRERESEVEELSKKAVHPDAPFYMDKPQDRIIRPKLGLDISAPDNPAQKWPG